MLTAVLTVSLLANTLQDDAWRQAKRNLDEAFDGNSLPSDRIQAVQGIANASGPQTEAKTAEALIRALVKEVDSPNEIKVSHEVLAAIVAALGSLQGKEAVDEMITAAERNASWRPRCYVIKALGSIPGDRVTQTLLALAYSGRGDRANEPHIVIAAIDALVARGTKEALPVFHRVLRDWEQPWEARLSALNGIAKFGERSSIPEMIEALKSVSDAQGRLKADLIEALQRMTGMNLASASYDDWMKAWKAGSAGVGDDAGTQIMPIRPAEFFGLETRSSRIVFVLDKSGSMAEPASDLEKKPPAAPEPQEHIGTGGSSHGNRKKHDPIDPKRELSEGEAAAYGSAKQIYERWMATKVTTRIELLKKEFIKALFWLDHRIQFAVFFYDTTVTPMVAKMIPATWPNKLQTMEAVEKLGPEGGTNIGDALFDHAMNMVSSRSNEGKYDGPPVIKTGKGGKGHVETVGGPDTIYLLTDGQPNAGRFSPVPDGRATAREFPAIHERTKTTIMNELKKVIETRKVKIHTICLGDSTDEPYLAVDPRWLGSIAELTGGASVHVSGK